MLDWRNEETPQASKSVPLLVCVLMSKAAEKVTGGLGELENRRSVSSPSEFHWFLCAHWTLVIDKHIVVFPWWHSLLWQQLTLSLQPAGKGEEVMKCWTGQSWGSGFFYGEKYGPWAPVTAWDSQSCWQPWGTCQGKAQGCDFALWNVSSS